MISKQNRSIRLTIIREAAGVSYGKNHWDLLDPDQVKILAHVIGKAGLSTATYAMFLGARLEDEVTDRDTLMSTGQEVIFVHRSLLESVPADLLLNKFTAIYQDRIQ
jgi:hypothetical protein